MRLNIKKYNLNIPIEENVFYNLVFEKPSVYANVIESLTMQINGGEGFFLLSKDGKEISISKNVELIDNPFNLDCNNKKVLTGLYKELSENATSLLIEESNKLNSEMMSYLSLLTDTVPYMVSFGTDLDICALLKTYDVHIDTESSTIAETLINYLNSMSTICGINFFFAVELKNYFEKNELELIYEFCRNNKIILVNIEGRKKYSILGDKYYIMDKDYCIIEV